jgi:hypothetical protein
MAGTWLDVDAPDTNWRSSSEDPIPLLFGRWGWTGFLYRYVTCRPLDGHARTDAGFLRPGTKPFTKSGQTPYFNYWPGWKRGLLLTRLPLLLLLLTGLLLLAGVMFSSELLRSLALLPVVGEIVILQWWITEGLSYARRRRFEKDYISPLRGAIIALLKTRDGIKLELERGLIRASSPGPSGVVYLPPKHPMPDGDRENLIELIRGRMGSEAIDGRYNMEGSTPYLELFVPAQPPSFVTWEEMLQHADPGFPFLGLSSSGVVRWDLHMDSPHMVVAGGSGSGKSELIAWIVAQMMRHGAGVIVLDPKYSSHLWLYGKEGVLYCSEPRMIHDTILWLDEELRSRGRGSQRPGWEMPPRIVVLVEERNSLQTLLRDHWIEVREPSMARTSPALAALDRLSSQGRSLGIHILLAGQETAERSIGSRANFGAFAVAGRMPANKWKLTGAARKPAISTRPGRFGYVCGDQVTVFQAAYPDLKHESARLLEYAFSGEVAPLDVQALMMMEHASHTFPSSEPASSLVSVSGFIASEGARTWFANQKQRYPERFPQPVDTGPKGSLLYREEDLQEYWDRWHPTVDESAS